MSIPVWQISEVSRCIMSGTRELQIFLFVQIHPWVNFESLLQKCLVGHLVQSSKSAGAPRAANKTTNFIRKLFTKRGRTPCHALRARVSCYLSTWICCFQLAFTNVCCCTLTWSRVQLKCDGTRRTGGEVKGKLANAVGSQYSSHYLGTWCIQHYYRWCAHFGCQ